MQENVNSNIKKPKINYVTIEIKKIKKDENGHIYESIEEEQVPEFLANILTGNGNIFIDDNN